MVVAATGSFVLEECRSVKAEIIDVAFRVDDVARFEAKKVHHHFLPS